MIKIYTDMIKPETFENRGEIPLAFHFIYLIHSPTCYFAFFVLSSTKYLKRF